MADPNALPDLERALRELLRRQIRAIVWLLVRIVLLGMLTATLVMTSPALRQNRFVLDALSGIAALWPFWTEVGRNWRWRIALGKAFYEAGLARDAVRILKPLDGIQGLLFDADGEGKRWLAAAREGRSEKS